MRPLVAAVGFAVAAMLAGGSAGAADRTCAALETFPNPKLLAAMRRGVNLPGWDSEGEGRRPTAAQLQALRDRGFTHIRLLLDDSSLSGPQRDAYLEKMFEQIILLFSLDYAVSLDLHAGGIFQREPGTAEARLGDLWQAIAKRVRFLDPEKLAVELLNEPQTDSANWWPVAGRLAAAVRRILPDHTIVVGPAGPQRHETLAGLEPLRDRNIVYAVHYYDPFAFTHQGADWGGADDPIRYLRGLPFPASASDPGMKATIAELKAAGHDEAANILERSLGAPWTEGAMTPAFETMADWSAAHAQPVIVNEFGVLSYHAPRQARIDWLAAVRRRAEQLCIGWTHWDFQDGFGLIDPETGMPDPKVMDALIPRTK
ncbi:cellulase family glycosylhydrolase [Mesorhizobium sp. KR9-304]